MGYFLIAMLLIVISTIFDILMLVFSILVQSLTVGKLIKKFTQQLESI